MASLRLLVIDDDPMLRESLADGLHLLGDFDVIVATDGANGLEQVREYRPDGVIVDVRIKPPRLGVCAPRRAASKPPAIKTKALATPARNRCTNRGSVVVKKPLKPMKRLAKKAPTHNKLLAPILFRSHGVNRAPRK